MPLNPPKSAGGWNAIFYSLRLALRSGPFQLLKALASKNACKTCALGMGGQKGGMRNESGRFPSVCNKSVQAQSSDMQAGVDDEFFARHSVAELSTWTPRELEHSGRLVSPLICEPGSEHYRPISWPEAMDRLAVKMKSTSPERSFFYFSGRSSNEAGFLLQLFARVYGTNNVNNCSYYCHQASGVGLTQSLGTGTATIELEDLDHADLVFLIGANPPSNHPRFMTTLMEVRRRGGRVIVVNPARERGLENFSVPSDWRSMLFGSEIASSYIQPNIGGDVAFCKGVAKALFQIAHNNPEVIDRSFIESATENFSDYKQDVENSSWEDIEKASGLSQELLQDVADQYAGAKNTVFAWAMGLTHHAHGVANVQSIVNLALLRGMAGRPHAGLLPLRGHSNVQGMGSMGVAPQLKKAVFDNLESLYGIALPKTPGRDTLACMQAAREGKFDFAWNLGGNLYGSNPDSRFAQEALSKIDFTLYMNTTLNQSHFLGRGKTSLILPVLARDEEPEPTTQESMFSYVRMSDGGPARHKGPRSEASIIVETAERVAPDVSIPWSDFKSAAGVRKTIGAIIPGFEKLKDMDKSREEFHIAGRILHQPQFPTANGKAKFKVCPTACFKNEKREANQFKLMTVRSEGQFNTVVYETEDKYRGIQARNVVLMNPVDIEKLGMKENDRVTVGSSAGELDAQVLLPYPIKAGNIMMYYPEANVLVPLECDAQSKTPSFKSVDVRVEKETAKAG